MASDFPVPPPIGKHVPTDESRHDRLFRLGDCAFFCTLIMAYLIYLGKAATGLTPGEVLSLPLVIGTTICLLSSSLTAHLAEKLLRRAQCRLYAAVDDDHHPGPGVFAGHRLRMVRVDRGTWPDNKP
jgi:hypothetical protein